MLAVVFLACVLHPSGQHSHLSKSKLVKALLITSVSVFCHPTGLFLYFCTR